MYRLPGRLAPLLTACAAAWIGCGDDDSTGPQPETGSIQITLTMAGESLDADGCTFTVDATGERRLTAGQSTTYTGLAAGAHVAAIADIAGNCQLQGDIQRQVTVTADNTTTEPFAVTCTALSGSIAFTTTTTGEDPDIDGYEFLVDGGVAGSIDNNGSVTTGSLTPGNHSMELRDIAFNCSVDGPNPRTVSVLPGVETPVAFDVTCRYHLYNRIAFLSMRTGEMVLHTVDPQTPSTVRSLGIPGEHPAVSPDGLRIAYDWDQDIWVADSDGSNAVNLTQTVEVEEFPAWSPDGGRLVFTRSNDLWLMDEDGSNQTSLGVNGWSPTWSPDGTQIAFTSAEGVSSNEIWVMNADGTGPITNVSNDPAWDAHPAWSPLGNFIAFGSTRDGNIHIFVVDPAGGVATNMTAGLISVASSPTWAPDAVAGAFQSDAGGNEDIYYFAPGGTAAIQLTTDPNPDTQPSWGGGN